MLGGRFIVGWGLCLGLALFLFSCQSVNSPASAPEDPAFRLSACLGAALPMSATDSGVGLRVLYVSVDSVRFIVPFNLNCGFHYVFTASLPVPDTLAVDQRVVGGDLAKCNCRKDLTVSLKAAPGQAFDKVKALKADGLIYYDFH